jgi:septum formation protein
MCEDTFMIVLASGSPRRGEILTNAGIPFVREVPTDIDETPRPAEPPMDYVVRLARKKAESVEAYGDRIVLGADTTVVIDGQILGKPSSPADAVRILRLLSGRSHEVITGICLRSARVLVTDVAVTRVRFASLSDSEIEAYAASGEPLDKAGAYGIQGLASKFVERILGCYFNVMGLPIALVYAHLRTNPAFMI